MHRILIIDDEPWSRQVVRALGDWDKLKLHVVGEAGDGTEGLRLIGELMPHIVVTDMRMPGKEGVELLQAMRERAPALKIIVMSGYDDFAYLKQAVRSRAVDYLLKPIAADELNASLTRCVRELEQARVPSLILADPGLLEQYLAYRERVYGYLLELNRPAVLQTFAQLERFLARAYPDSQDEKMRIKIAHDFMLMLGEFIGQSELRPDRLDRNADPDWALTAGWNSLAEAIEHIGQLYAEAIDAIEALHKNRNRLDLRDVQTHIDRHFHSPISLETVAQHFFVSKEHLSRAFKSFAGENVSDYIMRRRMEKARELIVIHRLAIKHVAELTGYADLAYFYRVFKRHFGLTPGELRSETEVDINKVQ